LNVITTSLHPIHIFPLLKIYRVELCTNCFMLSSLPCFYAFCWSAIPTSCYILAADAYSNWSLPSITEQQVSPHRLPMQYWLKIIDQTRLSSNTPRTSTAIFRNNCISLLSDLCACVHVKKKNGIVKEAIVLQWAVRIALCDFKPGEKGWAGALLSENAAVLCENHCERVMQISATGCVVHHENTWRWTVGCYNGL